MSESSLPAATRKASAQTALDCFRGYLLLAALCLVLKVIAALVGRPAWLIDTLTWPEVFYGPAIAMGTVFGLSLLSARIEDWLHRRRIARG
jgi:hypothetical protein